MRALIDPIAPVPAFHSTAVTPYFNFNQDDWLMSAVASIKAIAALPHDWNSYGAPPLTAAATNHALELALGMSRSMPEPRIAPVAGGGLQFEWTLGPGALELEVMPDGAIEYLRVYPDDAMREGRLQVSLDTVSKQVRTLLE